MPHRDSVPMPWRMSRYRYGLVGSACKCGALHMPVRALCAECGSDTQPYTFVGTGEILAHTIIHAAPDGFEKNVPYAIGLIKLTEGPVISSQIVGDTSKIDIGKKVKVVFRKLHESGSSGVINYGFKFELEE